MNTSNQYDLKSMSGGLEQLKNIQRAISPRTNEINASVLEASLLGTLSNSRAISKRQGDKPKR